MNERKTERLVRELLASCGYFSNDDIIVEEQISDSPLINSLLKRASKKGNGKGYPEFIIRSKSFSDFVIVIECKSDIKYHESKTKDNYADFAVDGANWYAAHLSKEFDVLSIGVSGQYVSEVRITHNLILKRTEDHIDGVFGKKILPFKDYHNRYLTSPQKFHEDYLAILEYTQDLNELLHSKKIKEAQRSLLISGILIALQNEAFINSYGKYKTAKRLAKALVDTIVNELVDASIESSKVENLKQAYSFIQTNTTLSNDKDFFISLIKNINEKVNSFIKTHRYFDTLGQLYIEFLRYANNDKGLGIVLTPPHITDLFSDLAEVSCDDIIVDNCCGTAGFMISAMKKMVQDAKGDSDKIKDIKRNKLIGVEYQDDIYALAVSNMIIHGDGKANVIHGDCFNSTNLIPRKGTIGFLNPPYKTKKTDKEELEFMLNNLSMLEKHGKCVAIVPMRCVLSQRGRGLELKRKLLEKHTLEAVFSLSPDLFHNSKVGVVPCIILVTAHVPHSDRKKTWFGYWKEDGFEKTRNRGRIDLYNKWEDIKDHWLSTFANREVIPGYSVAKQVSCEDEWCAEAFMETDYSNLSVDVFKSEVKKYVAFKILNGSLNEDH